MNLNLFISKKIAGKTGTVNKLTKKTNSIATFSVAVSVFVIFIAISVGTGFQKELSDKAVGFSGSIIIIPPGQGGVNELYPFSSDLSYLDKIASLKEVSHINKVAYKSGIIKSVEEVQGAIFRGADSLYNLSFFESNLVDGCLPDFSTRRPSNDILISLRMSKMLNLNVGDELLAYYVDKGVRVRRFNVVGLYDVQLEEVDKTLVLVDIRHIINLNSWNRGDVSELEVMLTGSVADKSYINSVIESIDRIIVEESLENDPSVIPISVRDHYMHLFDWLDLLDLNVLIVLVLMVAVAGFNMISTLLIILLERISMIGILKTLGMRDRAISSVFLYIGSFIVLKGMTIGNILAMVFIILQDKFHMISLNPENYYISYIPVNMTLSMFIIINLASFLVMTAILLIPTLFISRVSPDKTIKVS